MRTAIVALLIGVTMIGAAPVDAQQEGRRARADERGWIGITFRSASSSAGGSLIVEDVYPESPAQRAGVQVGDTIVRWNGSTDPSAVIRDLRTQAGDTVRLRLRRGGVERALSVIASPRPSRIAEVRGGPDGKVVVIRSDVLRERLGVYGDSLRIRMDSLTVHADSLHHRLRVMFRDSLSPRLRELEGIRIPDMEIHISRGDSVIARALGNLPTGLDFALGARGVAGAELSDLTPGLGSYFGTDSGVLVLRVGPDTPAARAGLKEGDVVVRANGAQVESVRDLRRAVVAASNRQVELEVMRRGARQSLTLRWER